MDSDSYPAESSSRIKKTNYCAPIINDNKHTKTWISNSLS